MASTAPPMARRLLLRRLAAASPHSSGALRSRTDPLLLLLSGGGGIARRSVATSASPLSADPSRFVAGVTREQIETDPAIAAFFSANFPNLESEPDVIDPRAELNKEEEKEERAVYKVKEVDERLSIDPTLAALNIRPLYCFERCMKTEEGTNACNRLREKRLIPGMIIGSDPTLGITSARLDSRVPVKTPWNLIQREFARYHRHFESRVYELTVYQDEDDLEGISKHRVVPVDVQRHPFKNKVDCVNYLRYHPGRVLKIPIRYVNEEESPAMKRGGFIPPIARYVPCIVEDGAPIPQYIDMDCTGLQWKQVVRTERLMFPEGTTMDERVDKEKFLVGTVFGRRALLVIDEDEEGGKEGEGESQED